MCAVAWKFTTPSDEELVSGKGVAFTDVLEALAFARWPIDWTDKPAAVAYRFDTDAFESMDNADFPSMVAAGMAQSNLIEGADAIAKAVAEELHRSLTKSKGPK